ncbi:GTP 3',8-cyclase MoaA [Candidatus Omnitrophota bacterium]
MLKYLKIFLHNECNFHCISCQDSFTKEPSPHSEVLATEEIAKLVDGFARLGVEHVRIIGGEPLLREDILDFIYMISSAGRIKQISLTTNGFCLKDKALALKGAGLNRVNIYLSSLDKVKFKKITGVDGLNRVLEGICAAKEADISPIRINVSLVKGLNFDELEDFATLSILYPLDIRFIEYCSDFTNPANSRNVSVLGYVAKNNIEFVFGKLIPEKANANEGPATYYRIKDARGRIGFINPVTEFFCVNCNAAMLYNDGRLFPCLCSSAYIDLAGLLRSGEYKVLAERIRNCFVAKPQVNKYTKIEDLQAYMP